MKLYCFERTQVLPIPLPEAWDFFSNPGNLREITPESMKFEVTSDLPDRMYPGMVVSYKVYPFPLIPVKWVTVITHVDEPRMFVDEQRFGPYRFWHHQHHFKEVDGGVEMRDVVHYGLYGWPVTGLANLVVKRQLNQIFEHREIVLEERFGKSAS